MCVAYRVLAEGGTLEVGKMARKESRLVVLRHQEEEISLTWLARRAAPWLWEGPLSCLNIGNNDTDLAEFSDD